MEWINGTRCTDPAGVRASGIDVNEFIRNGVVSALRQLLEARVNFKPLLGPSPVAHVSMSSSIVTLCQLQS